MTAAVHAGSPIRCLTCHTVHLTAVGFLDHVCVNRPHTCTRWDGEGRCWVCGAPKGT